MKRVHLLGIHDNDYKQAKFISYDKIMQMKLRVQS